MPDDDENDERVLAALRRLNATRQRDGEPVRPEHLVAGLSSIVGFKRRADRPRDRNDLLGLVEIHGELPHEPIPGLDD